MKIYTLFLLVVGLSSFAFGEGPANMATTYVGTNGFLSLFPTSGDYSFYGIATMGRQSRQAPSGWTIFPSQDRGGPDALSLQRRRKPRLHVRERERPSRKADWDSGRSQFVSLRRTRRQLLSRGESRGPGRIRRFRSPLQFRWYAHNPGAKRQFTSKYLQNIDKIDILSRTPAEGPLT